MDNLDKRDDLTQFIVCGNYACWRRPNELKIKILNVKEMKDGYNSPFDYSQGKCMKIIDLTPYFEKTKLISDKRHMISIEPCSPLFALHFCSDEKFGKE